MTDDQREEMAPEGEDRGLIAQLGVPWLFAAAYSTVGFSVYISLGVVAERALSLTPVIFFVAGALFVLTTLTYMEGGSMFRERGGSASIARHAFNELVSFVAGWAILIDLLIIIALAAVSVPHYLTPLGGFFGNSPAEGLTAAAVIAIAVGLNAAGVTGKRNQGKLGALALADVAAQTLVIVVGAVVVMNPDALTAELDLFSSPDLQDILYAAVLATIAYAGIEAAANLAPDLKWRPEHLRRVIGTGTLVPVLYAAMAAVALMALPVTQGPGGPESDLSRLHVEAPVLGVVASFDPQWLSDVLRLVVMAVATVTLVGAAYTAMLGVSRVSYTLATNRQIPSWMGRLGKRTTTPFVVIAGAGALSLALALPADIEFLVGLYAFGATLAITIAHLSVIKLRFSERERERPFRIPMSVRMRGADLPLPAVFGALVGALAWVSVLVLHDEARWVGGGWMAFGLVFYVGYRMFEGVSIFKRIEVAPEALQKKKREVAYRRILVPVFGTDLDDDIVSTAGRIAVAVAEDSRESVEMRVVGVHEIPVALPLDAALDHDREVALGNAVARAFEFADEYEGVNVTEVRPRSRSTGAGIVAEAMEWGAEVIVLGAEPPSTISYVGGSRPPEIGKATEYVLTRAPCKVLLTAPPGEGRESDAAA